MWTINIWERRIIILFVKVLFKVQLNKKKGDYGLAILSEGSYKDCAECSHTDIFSQKKKYKNNRVPYAVLKKSPALEWEPGTQNIRFREKPSHRLQKSLLWLCKKQSLSQTCTVIQYYQTTSHVLYTLLCEMEGLFPFQNNPFGIVLEGETPSYSINTQNWFRYVGSFLR